MPDDRPQSTVQAVGRVAEDVVGGLKTQPTMLGLVVLNLIGIGAALWFLHELMGATHDQTNLILQKCLPGGTT